VTERTLTGIQKTYDIDSKIPDGSEGWSALAMCLGLMIMNGVKQQSNVFSDHTLIHYPFVKCMKIAESVRR